MDTNHEVMIAKYSAMLKAKVAHISGLSAEQRAVLRQQWLELVDEVKAALDEDPAGPKAQSLLHRWALLLQALTGTDATKFIDPGSASTPFRATPEIRDALWARQAEWLPADAERKARELTDPEEARAQVQEQLQLFAGRSVLGFIKRARAARG